MTSAVKAIVRGAMSLCLFVLFGIGALLITPPMLLLRRTELCQPIVRFCWRVALFLFVATQLIRIERDDLAPMRGSVIAANHPSLIDVLILTVLVPRTLYVAKHGLLSNPFLSAIVRATALPDDARLAESAARYLAEGWNVLIFPEGTRSPAGGGLNALHRGAVQLSLRTGAPLTCVRIDVSRRLLGKHQPPWDMGTAPVVYSFHSSELPCRREEGESVHHAAVRLTKELANRLTRQR